VSSDEGCDTLRIDAVSVGASESGSVAWLFFRLILSKFSQGMMAVVFGDAGPKIEGRKEQM
jgi:hypothetical protein